MNDISRRFSGAPDEDVRPTSGSSGRHLALIGGASEPEHYIFQNLQELPMGFWFIRNYETAANLLQPQSGNVGAGFIPAPTAQAKACGYRKKNAVVQAFQPVRL